MQLHVGAEFRYSSTYPTPAAILVQTHPDNIATLLEESWDAGTRPHEFVDLYGNRTARLILAPGDTRIRYDALVEVPETPDATDEMAAQLPVEALPDDVLHFTLASRYCLSDALLGTAWELFGNAAPGWARAQAVCDWIHDNIRYGHEHESTPLTTALDTFNNRAGICRDFAHLGVTFCRALNIPARYVCGYLADVSIPPPVPPQDFHAWFEVYLGGRWWPRDARFNTPMIGRVPVARGRDAVDTALVTSYGPAQLTAMTVITDEITSEVQVLSERLAPDSPE